MFQYNKEESEKHDGRIKQSMKKIGEKLNTSEATVHRAVRKLRNHGIIGIVPSQEKAESNEIVYYGLPNEEEQANEIFEMVNHLNSSINRFKTLLSRKD